VAFSLNGVFSGSRPLCGLRVAADRTRRVDVVRDASVTVRCLGTRNAGPAGYNERLLAMIWFDLLPRDDLTADTAEIAQRHVAARAA
jgi:hypothetical protein